MPRSPAGRRVIDILTGFSVIAIAVLVGWIAARTGVLPPEARPVLAKLNFTVLGPFLLFSVLSTADVGTLFSALLPVSAVAAAAMMLIFAAVSLFVWRRSLAHTVIGSLASGYVNGNNFGIPIAVYMLGDAALAGPIVLLQLMLFAPVGLAILGATVEGRTSFVAIVRGTLLNPIIVGSLLGVLVAVTGLELPPIVSEPIDLIGHAAVPLMLIAFGMSLHGKRLLEPGTDRRDVLLATVLQLIVMPLAAWALGAFVFGLEGHDLYAVTVLAALPAAQNVFVFAQRYSTAETVARDTVFLTTAGSLPVLLAVALLLGT
ncbi:AEC family transporter [Agromyces aerolatus]|uniref:AEC family transporter n=1 Tax=Agromyces sp. LY-1074 TaxID=3074080 RepID=UPI00285B6D88|nr:MULTISPECIES: AEC family transporter [unclassified Agromyces]MDR5698517.1 AEC family transporter [Agromyces sp. LY-1074]MDR5704811.1 AEC family transporter [Agromyces sp. LY-1358]